MACCPKFRTLPSQKEAPYFNRHIFATSDIAVRLQTERHSMQSMLMLHVADMILLLLRSRNALVWQDDA